MELPEPDLRIYYNELNSFLNLLRDEIHLQSQILKADHMEPEALEAYLLDLNTYYYQSFHERFFSDYKSQLEAEVMSLYRISREEASLKADIIRNLKRVAQIYNRIKSGSSLLKTNRESIYTLLLSSKRGQEQRIVELLYILKELEQSLGGFLTMLNNYQNHLADQQLLNSLNEYPFQAAIYNLLQIWEADNNRFTRDFKRILINIQLMLKLLLKLQNSEDPCLEARNSLLSELEKAESSLAAKKSSPVQAQWYKQHIQKQLRIYLDLLGLYTEKNDRKRCLQTAQGMENWLQALLYLLEKASLSPDNLGSVFLDLPMMTWGHPAGLKKLNELCSKTAQSLQALIQNLNTSSQPIFVNFHTSASAIIGEAQLQFKRIQEQEIITDGTVLANALHRLSMQFSLLDGQLDLLQDKEEHAIRLKQQYELMLQNMDSYMELLQDIKNELSRSLAPRNINRNFKDMDVRVEQIAINQGELFPAPYLHLLDSSQLIDADPLEQDYTVLEEEGDIFIFKLDELYEQLIPRIVVNRKG